MFKYYEMFIDSTIPFNSTVFQPQNKIKSYDLNKSKLINNDF